MPVFSQIGFYYLELFKKRCKVFEGLLPIQMLYFFIIRLVLSVVPLIQGAEIYLTLSCFGNLGSWRFRMRFFTKFRLYPFFASISNIFCSSFFLFYSLHKILALSIKEIATACLVDVGWQLSNFKQLLEFESFL